MQFSIQLIATMAALLTSASAARVDCTATGSTIVQNTCQFPVWIQSFAGPDAGPKVVLAPGNAYQEKHHLGKNGGGAAIKITNDNSDWSTPLLAEIAPSYKDDKVYYDMSVSPGGRGQSHDGVGLNYKLTPAILNPAMKCEPVTYANSYVHLGEQDGPIAVKSCPLVTDLTLTLC